MIKSVTNVLPPFAAIAVVKEVAAVTRRIRLRKFKKKQKTNHNKLKMDSNSLDSWLQLAQQLQFIYKIQFSI